MHYATIGVLVIALGSIGCDRQAPPATTDNAGQPPVGGSALVSRNGNEAAASAARVGIAPDRGTHKGQPRSAAETSRHTKWHEVTIPSGTSLALVLETPVGSDTSSVEAPVTAHLARAVTIDGVTAVPQGSEVTGVVTEATRAAKVKGLAQIAMRFDTLSPRGADERYHIETSPVARSAAATKKEDTVKILAPAVGGAIIGRIAGGRKGAAIGAGAGAGAGTAVVMSTRGKEVRLAKGATLTLRLTEPLTVRVRS
jgi:hypothetical protein